MNIIWKVLINLLDMLKNITGKPHVYKFKDRKFDILIKSKKFLIIYFVTIPTYVIAFVVINENIVPMYKNDFLLPTIFIFIFLLIVSYIELVPKKILLSVLEKESKYPYNTVVRMQNHPFFFTTSKKRYSTAIKFLDNCFLGGECDKDFLKYYFYKNNDFKSYEEINQLNSKIEYYVNNYTDDLKIRHDAILSLLPYGLKDYKEYFAKKAASDFSPSYLNIFYYLGGLVFIVVILIAQISGIKRKRTES